jgi:transcriptional regulator with XRE-family HTH domain
MYDILSNNSNIVQNSEQMNSDYLHTLGFNIQTWRKLQGISASALAARAGISRNTLAALEQGTGSTSLANTFAVLEALGIAQQVAQSSHPAQTEIGRTLIYQMTKRSAR